MNSKPFYCVWLLFSLAAASLSFSQTIETGPPLVVVDSEGTQVGHLIDRNTAVITVGGRHTVVYARREEVEGPNMYLYYTGPNCTGDPYFSYDITMRFTYSPSAHNPTDGTLILTDNALTPQQLSYPSRWEGSHCSTAGGTTDDALPVVASVDLASAFVPPFSVQEATFQQVTVPPVDTANSLGLLVLGIALGCTGILFLVKRHS